MAQQGSYPIGSRTLALTDTATGVVTGSTADIPLSAIVALSWSGATNAQITAAITAWFKSLPTTLPGSAGVLWNNGGTLALS